MSHSFLSYMGATTRLNDSMIGLMGSLLIRLIEADLEAPEELRKFAVKWRGELKHGFPGVTILTFDGYLETEEGRHRFLQILGEAKRIFAEGERFPAKRSNDIDVIKDPQRRFVEDADSAYLVASVEQVIKICV